MEVWRVYLHTKRALSPVYFFKDLAINPALLKQTEVLIPTAHGALKGVLANENQEIRAILLNLQDCPEEEARYKLTPEGWEEVPVSAVPW